MALEDAIAYAANAHKGQVDRNGEPYIRHALRAMETVDVPSPDEADLYRSVAVLHDVCEDCGVEPIEVCSALDLPFVAHEALIALTRRDGEPYRDYIDRCRENEIARAVKRADLRDNLQPWRRPPAEDDSLRRRYERALGWLTGIPPIGGGECA